MWTNGNPTSTGLYVIEWCNGCTWPEVYLVVKCKDGNLYLSTHQYRENRKPYPLSRSAIKRHYKIEQPDGDGMNINFHTKDFDPEICAISDPDGKKFRWLNYYPEEHNRKPLDAYENESLTEFMKRLSESLPPIEYLE
jgi:hypothetical protein